MYARPSLSIRPNWVGLLPPPTEQMDSDHLRPALDRTIIAILGEFGRTLILNDAVIARSRSREPVLAVDVSYTDLALLRIKCADIGFALAEETVTLLVDGHEECLCVDDYVASAPSAESLSYAELIEKRPTCTRRRVPRSAGWFRRLGGFVAQALVVVFLRAIVVLVEHLWRDR